MFYFVIKNFTVIQTILFFIWQFLPFSLLSILAMKFLFKEKPALLISICTLLSSMFFSVIYAVIIYQYCPDILYIHGFMIVFIQSLTNMIVYYVLWKDELDFLLGLVLVSVFSMLIIEVYCLIYPSIIQFDRLFLFSKNVLNWYLLLSLLLLPLLKKLFLFLNRRKNVSVLVMGIVYFFLAVYFILVQKVSISRYPNGSTRFFVANSLLDNHFLQEIHPEIEIVENAADSPMFYSMFLPALFVVGISMVIFFFLNYLYTRKQLEYKKRTEAELMNYVQKIESLTLSVRQRQHDFTNMLLSLGGYVYAEDCDQDKLKEYFEKICAVNEDEYRIFSEMSKIRNIQIPELKALIFSKMMQAQDNNVEVDLEINKEVSDTGIENLELIRIIGILLDNAIEAAAECDFPSVRLAIIQKEDETTFIVMNTTGNKLALNLISSNASSKGDNRGLGLSIIQKILTKYENKVLFLTEIKNSMVLQTIKIKRKIL